MSRKKRAAPDYSYIFRAQEKARKIVGERLEVQFIGWARDRFGSKIRPERISAEEFIPALLAAAIFKGKRGHA